MASSYVAKVFPANPIDHGDAVRYDPDKAIKDADIGYEGTAPETLNSRLQFSDPWSAWYNDSGVPSASLGKNGDLSLIHI